MKLLSKEAEAIYIPIKQSTELLFLSSAHQHLALSCTMLSFCQAKVIGMVSHCFLNLHFPNYSGASFYIFIGLGDNVLASYRFRAFVPFLSC